MVLACSLAKNLARSIHRVACKKQTFKTLRTYLCDSHIRRGIFRPQTQVIHIRSFIRWYSKPDGYASWTLLLGLWAPAIIYFGSMYFIGFVCVTPAFVASSTNVGEGLVKLSPVQWHTWTCGGVAHSSWTAVRVAIWCRVLSHCTVCICDRSALAVFPGMCHSSTCPGVRRPEYEASLQVYNSILHLCLPFSMNSTSLIDTFKATTFFWRNSVHSQSFLEGQQIQYCQPSHLWRVNACQPPNFSKEGVMTKDFISDHGFPVSLTTMYTIIYHSYDMR